MSRLSIRVVVTWATLDRFPDSPPEKQRLKENTFLWGPKSGGTFYFIGRGSPISATACTRVR